MKIDIRQLMWLSKKSEKDIVRWFKTNSKNKEAYYHFKSLIFLLKDIGRTNITIAVKAVMGPTPEVTKKLKDFFSIEVKKNYSKEVY